MGPERDRAQGNRQRIAVAASLAGAAALVLWSAPLLYLGEGGAALAWIAFAAVLLGGLVAWRLGLVGYRTVVLVDTLAVLVFPLLAALAIGRYTAWGGAWYLLLVVVAGLVWFPARYLVWCALAVVGLAIGTGIDLIGLPARSHPAAFFGLLYTGSVLTVAGITFAVLVAVTRQRDHAYELLSAERQRSEALLANILPTEIAERLKAGEQPIADRHDRVSVLFADIVNFTPLAAKLGADDLVALLDDVFSYFDDLVERHGVEKVKTIGDCYMMAAGLLSAVENPARLLAALAVEARDRSRSHPFAGGHAIRFRIGIHSGPLVAGVIGATRIHYDLWGDTVNMASRMESHAAEEVIQVAQPTFDMIRDEFECEPMGTVEVKGVGPLETWNVVRARPLS